MFDTPLTIVGNVLTAPEFRKTSQSNQVVASFRVASTARRFDKGTSEWVDGHSLRVRVTAWRRLAEGAVQSLKVGDPVIVVGRLYTRDWIDEAGVRRVLYELDAGAIGHDLARGTSTFQRHSSAVSTSTIEDEEAERRVGGEDSEPYHPGVVPPGEADDDAFEDERELAGV
ncbi:single-stranded DNA-binding protein [Catelliglobosispora koreensis]|uniref:single-stranded DNA-binding protein n=1 Tax=Catelliglobosispora koreensis TaxID=129052 RepID=UPI00035F2C5E